MATLHFICGKAGSGKTTLARELGRTLPTVVFCEDEWIDTLGFEIRSLGDFARASSKCRSVIAPLASKLLRLGVSVVFDFAGNTIRCRQWVRTILEAVGAGHVLHASASPISTAAMRKSRRASTGAMSATRPSMR